MLKQASRSSVCMYVCMYVWDSKLWSGGWVRFLTKNLQYLNDNSIFLRFVRGGTSGGSRQTYIHTYSLFGRRINIDINSCATHRIGIPNRICMSETLKLLCMFKINTCRCLMSPIQATYRVCCWGCKEYFHIDDPRLCLYVWKHSGFQTCIHAQASSRQTHALGDFDMGGAHKLNLY